MSHRPLQVVRFTTDDFPDLTALATALTELKAIVSRTPTPVTANDLEQIAAASAVCHLFIQLDEAVVVGCCMITVSLLEDRAHLGPIVVQKAGAHTGYGTQLMKTAIAYVWEHCPVVRRIDLSNRPDHDLATWYTKFGFSPRTEAVGDPTTVYRLTRST